MTSANALAQGSEPPPWWAAFPEPQAQSERIDAAEVKKFLDDALTQNPPKLRDFLLVDVRLTDWKGGTVATSVNLPCQSFYPTRPAVYQLCKQAGINKIIFYCGSSNGRGPRSANWMQDYLNEVGETDVKSLIMIGGIKGWQRAYGGQLMDWYDEKSWGE